MTAGQAEKVELQIQFYLRNPDVWKMAARLDYLSLMEGGRGPLSAKEMQTYYPGWTTEMFKRVFETLED